MNFKRSLASPKLIKDLKVGKGVIDVATNTIPCISATDENKDAKEIDDTGERVKGMDSRRIRLLNEVSTRMVRFAGCSWKDRV